MVLIEKKGLFNKITQSIQTKLRNPMDKLPNRNWCCLLSQFLYIFIATSCSKIKLPNFIPTQVDDQTQNNIENFSVSTTDNQVRLLNDNLNEKEKEITELRTILNNLNELKIKIENKNNQIFSLERELDRITYLNNSQTKQISHLQSELDQTKNIKQIQENKITRLKKKLDEITKLEEARALEKIKESSFFEP